MAEETDTVNEPNNNNSQQNGGGNDWASLQQQIKNNKTKKLREKAKGLLEALLDERDKIEKTYQKAIVDIDNKIVDLKEKFEAGDL